MLAAEKIHVNMDVHTAHECDFSFSISIPDFFLSPVRVSSVRCITRAQFETLWCTGHTGYTEYLFSFYEFHSFIYLLCYFATKINGTFFFRWLSPRALFGFSVHWPMCGQCVYFIFAHLSLRLPLSVAPVWMATNSDQCRQSVSQSFFRNIYHFLIFFPARFAFVRPASEYIGVRNTNSWLVKLFVHLLFLSFDSLTPRHTRVLFAYGFWYVFIWFFSHLIVVLLLLLLFSFNFQLYEYF